MIVLRAKGVEFEITHITADNKPKWFLDISPHGKVPVLMVDKAVLFESNAIAEFLEETIEPNLHPKDPVKRARNRAWNDFVPEFSKIIGAVNYATTKKNQGVAASEAKPALNRIEEALDKERPSSGPFFNGVELCIVDAAYAPFFLRFSIVEELCNTGLLADFPKVNEWALALLSNPVIVGSVVPDFKKYFEINLRKRGAYASTLLPSAAAAE